MVFYLSKRLLFHRFFHYSYMLPLFLFLRFVRTIRTDLLSYLLLSCIFLSKIRFHNMKLLLLLLFRYYMSVSYLFFHLHILLLLFLYMAFHHRIYILYHLLIEDPLSLLLLRCFYLYLSFLCCFHI